MKKHRMKGTVVILAAFLILGFATCAPAKKENGCFFAATTGFGNFNNLWPA